MTTLTRWSRPLLSRCTPSPSCLEAALARRSPPAWAPSPRGTVRLLWERLLDPRPGWWAGGDPLKRPCSCPHVRWTLRGKTAGWVRGGGDRLQRGKDRLGKCEEVWEETNETILRKKEAVMSHSDRVWKCHREKNGEMGASRSALFPGDSWWRRQMKTGDWKIIYGRGELVICLDHRACCALLIPPQLQRSAHILPIHRHSCPPEPRAAEPLLSGAPLVKMIEQAEPRWQESAEKLPGSSVQSSFASKRSLFLNNWSNFLSFWDVTASKNPIPWSGWHFLNTLTFKSLQFGAI